jgi:HEAT repeat protein
MNAFFNRALSSIFGVLLLSMPSLADSQETAKILSIAVNSSGKAQYTAIDDLGERHEDASMVVPKLRQLLKSDDKQVRWRSVRTLGDFGSLAKDGAPDIIKLLDDKDPIVDYHAVIALGKIEDRSDSTVAALIELATNKDARIARAAIASLRNLKPGPERVAAALKTALTSKDPAVSMHALEAIVEERGKAVPLLKETLKQPETAYLACAAIEQIGPDAADTLPELTELLGKTKHSQLLIQSLLATASLGPAAQSAESAILPHQKMTTDETVPVAAAYALGAIGAKDADASLKKALSRDNPFLHMVASWALAKLHPNDEQLMREAVAELTKGLSNEKPQMRTAAAKGLQMLQPPPEMVGPALMALASDPDPDVSANVVSALAGLGESAVPRLVKAMKNPKARPLALRVLTKMGPKAAGAVDPLIASAKQADPEFRGKIFLALAAIGPAAAPATESLIEGISNDDRRVRESALYALREIGPAAKAATRPLLRKLEGDRSFDSLAAAWALSRIALGNDSVGKKVLPVLIRGLSNSDEQTRLNSAEAIAEWGPTAASAAAELKKIAHEDKSSGVREAAEAALKRVSSRS